MATLDAPAAVELAALRAAFGDVPMPVAVVVTLEGDDPRAITVTSSGSLVDHRRRLGTTTDREEEQ